MKDKANHTAADHWVVCEECLGRGKKSRRLKKKVRLDYERAYALYQQSNGTAEEPIRPKASLYECPSCAGAGIQRSTVAMPVDVAKYPSLAIIGAGIGGVALAVACLHRGIPFTLYERDADFDARSQGYGLTLQQANRAIKKLGIQSLEEGIISTRHVVHTPQGEVIGEWGSRKWLKEAVDKNPKRSNMHIARQSLRKVLLSKLNDSQHIKWGHQLVDYQRGADDKLALRFMVNGQEQVAKADLLVGADGIRSVVRSLLLGEDVKPLTYLSCLVILGICPMDKLKDIDSPLLDGFTVFQTANGEDRIYVMPYSHDAVMWQFSCPMEEEQAKELSIKGAKALKEEALRRMDWHTPVPEIVAATDEQFISGYPVYDREILESELEDTAASVTLIGDAAHPMSPFKGQGANQALLDAIALAQQLYTAYHYSGWEQGKLREQVLTNFEQEMIARSSIKVQDSAAAVSVLHSDKVFQGGNQPRGLCKK